MLRVRKGMEKVVYLRCRPECELERAYGVHQLRHVGPSSLGHKSGGMFTIIVFGMLLAIVPERSRGVPVPIVSGDSLVIKEAFRQAQEHCFNVFPISGCDLIS